ncbi:hypothetical protein GQ53DRAFT_816835 [Thozetella sp. PMI_491]|nr:hypothetical protein GQ53DRAFT_816835 [Thozetella sp. PMI_491]
MSHKRVVSESSPGKQAAKQQLWFFLLETVRDDAFVQRHMEYHDILKLDMSLEKCLNMVGMTNPDQYTFWIHTGSMAAAVQLLSDARIIATYNLYCTDDPVVVVTMRVKQDPSPNSSRAPSYGKSLAQRRKISGPRGLISTELFVQPALSSQKVSDSIDVCSMEPVAAEDAALGSMASHLPHLGWIDARLADSKALTEILVEFWGSDGVKREFVLSADIWQTSLLRGPWKSTFAPVENPLFWQQCQNFVRDLRSFGSDNGARNRIEGTGHQFYIGNPYFDERTRDKLLAVPTRQGTLLDTLKALEKKRAGGTVCASHDLAPIFEGDFRGEVEPG